MNKKIASALVGILLIGIVAAGLVPYLSNIVSGSVEVKGPVFYAATSNQLLINEFDGSSSTYTIDDVDSEKFFTMSFDSPIDDFYKPNANLFVRARVSNGEVPKNLKLVFSYFDSKGNVIEICSSLVSITSDAMEEYSSSCEGSKSLTDVKGFLYKIDGFGALGVEYKISTKDGLTRVEVDKA